jgi:hypothetical protein
MLVRCLYASRVTKPLSPHLFESILEQSCKNNPSRGVTGLLCFTKNIFLQVIEGGRDEVNQLFFVIARDDRHNDVRLLAFDEVSQRRYSNWTMGQVDLDNVNADLILKYSEKPELNPFACSGHATLALLDELVATGSIRRHGR